MGRITSFSKQVIVFFLVTALIIRPTFASNVGGWSMGNPISQGASVVYEGTQNILINGADYVKKGTAKITPTAANVAKTLGKGVAGVAVSVAVEQLLGSVDWVLDPANNRIKYYTDNGSTDINDPTLQYYYRASFGLTTHTTIEAAAAASLAERKKTGDIDFTGTFNYTSSQAYACYNYNGKRHCDFPMVSRMANPAYNPSAESEREEKYLPLDAVAQKVISNAASGDTNAQAATTAAAADIVAEAQTDNVKARPIAQQLQATSTTKPADEAAAAAANTATGTQTQNPTKPETTDLALEFPAFCGWAPTLCEFAQTATQSIADIKAEYVDKPQENTDTELEIPDLEQDTEVDTDISFGGSCPAPLSSDINFMGLNKTIEFSFDPVCQIAEFIKPVVISISAFSAALIVAGIRTEDD